MSDRSKLRNNPLFRDMIQYSPAGAQLLVDVGRQEERVRIVAKLRERARKLGAMRTLDMTYSAHALNLFADNLATENAVMMPSEEPDHD